VFDGKKVFRWLDAGAIFAVACRLMKQNSRSSDPLLTVEQVAQYLNVNRFTVYRLLTQKRIPAFKVGAQWRFKQETIEAWLMKSAKNPHDEFSESVE